MEYALCQIGRYFVVVQVVPHRLGVRQLIRIAGHSRTDRLDEHGVPGHSGEDDDDGEDDAQNNEKDDDGDDDDDDDDDG